jgi:hypothetical protein
LVVEVNLMTEALSVMREEPGGLRARRRLVAALAGAFLLVLVARAMGPDGAEAEEAAENAAEKRA